MDETTWRYWGEESFPDVIYSVYLRKVRYKSSVNPTPSEDSHHEQLRNSYKKTSPPKSGDKQLDAISDDPLVDDISHLEWETVRVRFLKAATLEKLVDSLAIETSNNQFNVDGVHDSSFINIFLATYRTFASTDEILNLVIKKYETFQDQRGENENAEFYCKSLRQFIHVWIEQYSNDFNDPPDHTCLIKLEKLCSKSFPNTELERKIAQLSTRLCNIHRVNEECPSTMILAPSPDHLSSSNMLCSPLTAAYSENSFTTHSVSNASCKSSATSNLFPSSTTDLSLRTTSNMPQKTSHHQNAPPRLLNSSSVDKKRISAPASWGFGGVSGFAKDVCLNTNHRRPSMEGVMSKNLPMFLLSSPRIASRMTDKKSSSGKISMQAGTISMRTTPVSPVLSMVPSSSRRSNKVMSVTPSPLINRKHGHHVDVVKLRPFPKDAVCPKRRQRPLSSHNLTFENGHLPSAFERVKSPSIGSVHNFFPSLSGSHSNIFKLTSSSNKHETETGSTSTGLFQKAKKRTSRRNEHEQVHLDDNNFRSIHDIPEHIFARQLTKMDYDVFKRLNPHECLGSTWSSRNKNSKKGAATVTATVEQFNSVSYRLISTVLTANCDPDLLLTSKASIISNASTTTTSEPTNKSLIADGTPSISFSHKSTHHQRSRIISKWIDIAQELRILKNFSSLKAIISGLQSNPIYRLKKTWNSVSRDKLETFSELSRMFSEENNASTQRELLCREGTAKFAETVSTKDHHMQRVLQKHSLKSKTLNHGTIPYLGTFLTDLTMIDSANANFVLSKQQHDGNADDVNGCSISTTGDIINDELIHAASRHKLINFDKRRKEYEVLAQIKLLQGAARVYEISSDDILERDPAFEVWWHSILVLDENDAFNLSCQIEGKMSTSISSLNIANTSTTSEPCESNDEFVINNNKRGNQEPCKMRAVSDTTDVFLSSSPSTTKSQMDEFARCNDKELSNSRSMRSVSNQHDDAFRSNSPPSGISTVNVDSLEKAGQQGKEREKCGNGTITGSLVQEVESEVDIIQKQKQQSECLFSENINDSTTTTTVIVSNNDDVSVITSESTLLLPPACPSSISSLPNNNNQNNNETDSALSQCSIFSQQSSSSVESRKQGRRGSVTSSSSTIATCFTTSQSEPPFHVSNVESVGNTSAAEQQNNEKDLNSDITIFNNNINEAGDIHKHSLQLYSPNHKGSEIGGRSSTTTTASGLEIKSSTLTTTSEGSCTTYYDDSSESHVFGRPMSINMENNNNVNSKVAKAMREERPSVQSPYRTSNFYIIRVSVATEQSSVSDPATPNIEGVIMYKSIMVGNNEKTREVIRSAMMKHGLEGSPINYTLSQKLPNAELLMPDNANVYYAINTQHDLNFVLRERPSNENINSVSIQSHSSFLPLQSNITKSTKKHNFGSNDSIRFKLLGSRSGILTSNSNKTPSTPKLRSVRTGSNTTNSSSTNSLNASSSYLDNMPIGSSLFGSRSGVLPPATANSSNGYTSDFDGDKSTRNNGGKRKNRLFNIVI